jgi:uncharacterized protein (DUF302 family)
MTTAMESTYGCIRIVTGSFDAAVSQLQAALKQEGFGVLCEIDIQAKLKEKLGIEFPRYVILGACNPPLARQALERDMNLGLLLPCNAVVYEKNGNVHVGTVDAIKMLSVTSRPELEGLAREVNERLRRALDRMAPEPSVPVHRT